MSSSTRRPFLLGPIRQLITMRGLPGKGAIRDDEFEMIGNGGVVVNDGVIQAVGDFRELRHDHKNSIEDRPLGVVMPGLIDSHTHICFGGSRAHDYSMRIAGSTYQEILQAGGGIYDTVKATRSASQETLTSLTLSRLNRHLAAGVTTCEVKSGYGLSCEEELKMLRAIQKAGAQFAGSVIPTCLAAHVPAREFDSAEEYLEHITVELLPRIIKENLSNRIDVFVEPEAFPVAIAEKYLTAARSMGFALTVHADQFTTGGSALATRLNALSADHLEASGEDEWRALAGGSSTATVLPGACLGLGMNMAPARKLLDVGCRVAIASDWNPGSAPMGDLLIAAALLSVYEKLTHAETLAGITVRAAKALGLHDRGTIAQGSKADFIAFDTDDYREILYHQGTMKPSHVWINGEEMKTR